jgi:hypothetical protein
MMQYRNRDISSTPTVEKKSKQLLPRAKSS